MGGAIKQLFREAINAITRRVEDAPMPARRRRRGQAGRGFYRAARAALRRVLRLPPEAFAAPTFLADTTDWLSYWPQDADDSSDPCDTLDAGRNDLSLRL